MCSMILFSLLNCFISLHSLLLLTRAKYITITLISLNTIFYFFTEAFWSHLWYYIAKIKTWICYDLPSRPGFPPRLPPRQKSTKSIITIRYNNFSHLRLQIGRPKTKCSKAEIKLNIDKYEFRINMKFKQNNIIVKLV